MRESIARLRCFNHPSREAAVRCPSCGNFFCRECISEHEGRMLCSACLLLASAQPPVKTGSGAVRRVAVFTIVFLFIWFSFYLLGKLVTAIPKSYHEQTIWASASDRASE